MRITPDTVPVHIARAYGLGVRPLGAPKGPDQAHAHDIAHRDDVLDLQTPLRVESAADLVAAQVKKPVDFAHDDAPAAPRNAIPFYRHPADKNAAATSIEAGRVIDVSG